MTKTERIQVDFSDDGFYIETMDSKTKKKKSTFKIAQPIQVNVHWNSDMDFSAIMVDIFKLSGEHITGFRSNRSGYELKNNYASIILNTNFSPGKYYFKIGYRRGNDKDLKTLYNVGEFLVAGDWPKHIERWSGIVPIEHSWFD